MFMSCAICQAVFATVSSTQNIEEVASAFVLFNSAPIDIEFNTIYHGKITNDNTSDMYAIELTQPGRLSLNVTKDAVEGVKLFSVLWRDNNDVEMTDLSKLGVSSYNISCDLEIGVYFVSFSQHNGSTGTYSFMSTFTPALNNEKEPNNVYTEAQTLEFGEIVRGFLSMQDSNDYYRVVLTEPGGLSLAVQKDGFIDTPSFLIYFHDCDGVQFYSNGTNQGLYKTLIYLDAGVYYFNITMGKAGTFVNEGITGTYSISTSFLPTGNNEIEPNNDLTAAQLLTSGQTVRGFLNFFDRDDYYKYVLTEDDKLMVEIRKDTSVFRPDNTIVTWLDGSGNAVKNIEFDKGTNVGWDDCYSNYYKGYKNLPAGTYYIKIQGSQGVYELTISNQKTLPAILNSSINVWRPPSAAKSLSINITSNVEWAATSSEPWLTCSPTHCYLAKPSVTPFVIPLTLSVTGNTTGSSRTAFITISGGSKREIITVIQGETEESDMNSDSDSDTDFDTSYISDSDTHKQRVHFVTIKASNKTGKVEITATTPLGILPFTYQVSNTAGKLKTINLLNPLKPKTIDVKPSDVVRIALVNNPNIYDEYVVGSVQTGKPYIPIRNFIPKAPSAKPRLAKSGEEALFAITKGLKDPTLDYLQWRLCDPRTGVWLSPTWNAVTFDQNAVSAVIAVNRPIVGRNEKDIYQIMLRYNSNNSFKVSADIVPYNKQDKSIKKSVKTNKTTFCR